MKIKAITLCALFTAIALTVYIIENQFLPPIPVPCVKIGIANIVTLITLVLWDFRHSFLILAARIVLSSFFCGNGISFLYSACGGLCCLISMAAFLRFSNKRFIIAASQIGAASHSAGQLISASFVLKSLSVFAYFPIMLAIGAITSTVIGFCASAVCKNSYIKKLFGDVV